MHFAIYKIDVKKPKTFQDLSFIQKLLFEKQPKIKELSNVFILKQIPKTKFIKGTFKTKNIGNDIRIKIGSLKPEYEHLSSIIQCKGFFDFIKYNAKNLYDRFKKVFYTISTDYHNTTKETLYHYGDMKIEELMINRTPLDGKLEKTFNVLSFGKFAEMKKKYGFEHFFHLSLVAKVQGINIIIEKNEIINVSTSYVTITNTETKNICLKDKTLTINQLLNTTQKKQKKKDYFSFDFLNNNCQTFIRALLTNIDLYSDDINTFLFQNVEYFIKEMYTLYKIVQKIINILAWFNKITGRKIDYLFFYSLIFSKVDHLTQHII